MHRGRTWTQRQLIGLSTPSDYNARLLGIIAQGATAVSLIPCNSVFRGYDMDEVDPELLGTCGVVVNTVDHMDTCLAGVDIGRMSCAMNDPSPFTLQAFLLATAKRRGVAWDRIRGTSNQSDYLSHYVANHMFFRLALPAARRVLLDHIEFCNRHVPHWNPMSVVGQHMQQAGATPAEAMAFTFATALQTADDCIARGMAPDDVPAALHVLLRHLAVVFRGNRPLPRRAPHLGTAHARALRRQGPAELALQVPRADLRRGPHPGAAAQQHRPRHRAGDGRHPRRPAVAAHRRLRRGAVVPDRIRRPHRRRHAEHPARGGASHRCHRPARRQLLRRNADQRDGGCDPALAATGRRRRRHVRSGRGRRRAAADRRFGAPIPGEHRVRRADGGRRQRVPYRRGPQRTAVAAEARPAQRCTSISRRSRRTRRRVRSKAVAKAQDALARAANDGRANVFAAVVAAAEAGCTHGEICGTLRREMGFGHVQALV